MSGVDRSNPLPLWAQLLDDLRRRLAAGEFTEGFPTDAELVAEYGLSRHTVRDAVRRLQQEGVVSRERGRGTFVRHPSVEQPSGALYSLFRSIESQGFEQRSEVVDLSAATDARVAARLGLEAGAGLVRLERVRLADGQPLAHDVAWLPAKIARPLLGVDFTHTALYDELAARCGVQPTSGNESVTVALPDADERRILRLSAKQPIFVIERFTRHGDVPLEWRETKVRGDRFSFVTRWAPGRAYETAMEAIGVA
jgi:GntR family transcriptional regulator